MKLGRETHADACKQRALWGEIRTPNCCTWEESSRQVFVLVRAKNARRTDSTRARNARRCSLGRNPHAKCLFLFGRKSHAELIQIFKFVAQLPTAVHAISIDCYQRHFALVLLTPLLTTSWSVLQQAARCTSWSSKATSPNFALEIHAIKFALELVVTFDSFFFLNLLLSMKTFGLITTNSINQSITWVNRINQSSTSRKQENRIKQSKSLVKDLVYRFRCF